MDELEGKVVLVTGGSRGMGEEMVKAFAARGAHVIIASRKLANCVELADLVVADYGVRALPVGMNVSDWSQCDDLVERAYGEFGRVDVLINNAGLSPLYPSLDEVSEQLWDKVIGVNLKGPFRLTASIGTRMAAGDGGSIMSIGSIEAIRPQPLALPYAAAKGALHVLTEGFAQAFGPKVRVNTIQAGPFLTDISTNWPEGMREEIESKVALGRCADAGEIVGAALYFATSASSFVTGALLRVDGGWR
jgi:NAD(P)-dependent dehydrogenase (short-subunit alcohol dehydrogenase family)